MMREIPKWSDVRQAKHFKFGYIYSWTMATCGKYQSQKYKLALNGGVVRVTGHVTQLFKFQTPPPPISVTGEDSHFRFGKRVDRAKYKGHVTQFFQIWDHPPNLWN